MSRKDKFLRQCCSCRAFFEKVSLIRITKDYKDGCAKINNDGKIYGRSVYICNNSECIGNALKKKKIEKILAVSGNETLKELLYNCTK